MGERFNPLLCVSILLLLLCSTRLAFGVGNDRLSIRCMERERRALVRFKESLIDDYGRLSSWGSEADKTNDCCKWLGVHCSNLTGHIVSLHLRKPRFLSQPLRGKVSSSLLELHHLNYLDLSFNDFAGSQIPAFIGSLGRLQYLNLASTGFAGKIPRNEISNLTNLWDLRLGDNSDLSVENLEWLSRLSLLRRLDLSSVRISKIDGLRSIAKLPFLKELYLSNCGLSETIVSFPLANSSSPSLSIVDISNNNFISPLKTLDFLLNFSSALVDVDISLNSLKGPLPNAFEKMVSLENLDLSANFLEGEIPQSFRNLSHLRSLDLSHNSLSGQIPKFFHRNLLEVLKLGWNQITGSLPDLSSFPYLRELHLSDNKLEGHLPVTIGQLSELKILHASSNSIQGTISESHFANLSKLKELDLSLNSLALEFSSDWIPPFQLDVIKLEGCKLGPHFPKWLQTQNHFSELHIPSAGISDSVPNWFWDLSPNIHYLNLSNNQINGVLPDLSLKFAEFPSLDFSSNQFEGPLPLFPTNVTELYLSENKFTGSISLLCANFIALDLSDNRLSGELPDCWMHMMEGLIILNLAMNNFSGKISSSLGYLSQLETLHLCKNNFSGELPTSMKNLTSLRILDLGENKISGQIPAWIGTNMRGLRVLSLRVNGFSGSIPPNVCNLNDIQIFDISQNNISGNIPRCFNRFTSLVERNGSAQSTAFNYSVGNGNGHQEFMGRVMVQWKGRVAEYRKTLGLVKSIDLSSNKIVGQVPIEFASLRQLASLNLSRNNLTGNIFEKIGQMEMLESLDMSRNQLSGKVPASMARLNYLGVLDLSDNKLSGKIPSSTQLQGFNASVYANNVELCGLPLRNICPGEERARVPPFTGHGQDNESGEDEDKLITLEFYVSMILGFALGFWGVFGSILLKTSWGDAYFKLLNDAKDWAYVTAKVNMVRIQNKLKGKLKSACIR